MVVGKLGGFFDALGFTGIGVMIFGMIVWVFTHGFISGAVAKKIAVVPTAPTAEEYTKAEFYTAIPLGGVPLAFGVWRWQNPTVSDTMDAVGCFVGGGFLYEIANLVEIGSAKLSGML